MDTFMFYSQSLTGNQSSSSSSSSEDEESLNMMKREGFICAVCLDVYFSPYICHPCSHIFCEPCLRTLAKNSPTNTPCPLCRTVITHVFFQKGETKTQCFRHNTQTARGWKKCLKKTCFNLSFVLVGYYTEYMFVSGAQLQMCFREAGWTFSSAPTRWVTEA